MQRRKEMKVEKVEKVEMVEMVEMVEKLDMKLKRSRRPLEACKADIQFNLE